MRDQHFQVGECGTEPVGVATPVSGQRFGLWKGIDHERRTLMIAHFPLAQQPTLAVANRVQLRVQTVLVRRIHRGTAPFGSAWGYAIALDGSHRLTTRPVCGPWLPAPRRFSGKAGPPPTGW